MTCICKSVSSTIAMCPDHHKYWLNGNELASVSKVISQVYPRKSFDGVDPAVIERARERGVRVDRYLAAYVTTGDVTTEPGEWIEVLQRLERCIGWWDKNMNGTRVDCQPILYSEAHGVAGTADFRIGDFVLDLKNTAQAEASWKLQLGAYGEYGNSAKVGILHSTKDSCRYLDYANQECRDMWMEAIRWRSTIARIEAKK